jgi:poly-gamma-glutamate synthesis protein (capsule biosynthesis protein)
MSKRGITIAAVGDTICRQKRGHANDPFSRVHDLLSDTDITFANLETVLTMLRKPVTEKLITIRSEPYSATHYMAKHGINVVNLANNHILDYGGKEAIRTQQELAERDIVSGGLVLDGYSVPTIVQANGLDACFLMYHLYPIYDEGGKICVNYYENRYGEVFQEVEDCAAVYDIVIVSLHWGEEHVSRPSPAQVIFAQWLIDRGAKVVLGHHPHVVQGVQRYRDGLIAYSLGCFNFWMMNYLPDRWYHRLSFVLRLCVEPDGVSYFDRVPVWIDSTASPVPIEDAAQRQWAQQYFQDLDYAIPPGLPAVATHLPVWREWYEEVGRAYIPLTTRNFLRTILKFGWSRARKFAWWFAQDHTRLAMAGLVRAITKGRGPDHWWPTPPKEFGWE